MDDFNVNNNVNGVNGANNANNEEAAAAQNAENADAAAETLFEEENNKKPEEPKKDELTFSKDANGKNSVSNGQVTVSGNKAPSILASILGSFIKPSSGTQPSPNSPNYNPELVTNEHMTVNRDENGAITSIDFKDYDAYQNFKAPQTSVPNSTIKLLYNGREDEHVYFQYQYDENGNVWPSSVYATDSNKWNAYAVGTGSVSTPIDKYHVHEQHTGSAEDYIPTYANITLNDNGIVVERAAYKNDGDILQNITKYDNDGKQTSYTRYDSDGNKILHYDVNYSKNDKSPSIICSDEQSFKDFNPYTLDSYNLVEYMQNTSIPISVKTGGAGASNSQVFVTFNEYGTFTGIKDASGKLIQHSANERLLDEPEPDEPEPDEPVIALKYGIPEDDPMRPIIDPGHIILLYGIPRDRELPGGFAPDKYAASELPEGYRPVKERGAAYASADAPADDIDLASMSADEQAALYASRIGDLIFGAKNAEDVTKATSAALSEDNINFFAKATSNTPDNVTSMSLKTSKGIVSKIGEVAASQIDNLINSGELSDEQKTEYENQKIMIKDFIKERLEALEKQFKENQEKDDDDHGLEVE